MEDSVKQITYELGYHIVPDIEADKVSSEASALEQMISQNGGTILIPKEPKRIHLSYPIDHKHYAYFGVIDFNGPAGIVDTINDHMKLQTNVLRYLLLKKEVGDDIRTLGEAKQFRPREQSQTIPREAEKTIEKTPEQEAQLKKELENVLEKI